MELVRKKGENMNKTIEIDITDKNDFIEKYNQNIISNDVIEYIIKQAMLIGNQDNIKIVINKKCEIKKTCSKMIKEGLKEEYNRSLKAHHSTNAKQVVLMILGIILLYFTSMIDEGVIWKEILLISGWVPIWETIELELFPDAEGKLKRRIIKKLLNCEIVENNTIEEVIM